MNRVFSILASMALATPSLAGAQEAAEPSVFARMGTYIAVENVAQTAAYYEVVFGKRPMIELDKFVAFDVAGGTFAIAAKGAYAPDARTGAGSVPYIQVTNLERFREQLETRLERDVPAIISEPGIQLLKITDLNGQLIEFFELVG